MAYFRMSIRKVGDASAMKKNGSRDHRGIMTLREVAQYLGLHVMTVYKLTREGRMPAAKIGGQWRFKRDVLDEWLETQMHRDPG
jgi:excisionase family DNA binding protein